MIFTTIVLAGLLLFLFYWDKSTKELKRKLENIPGPKTLPFIGNAVDFLRSPIDLFTWVTGELAAFGPVVRVWVLNEAQVVITSAKHAEKLLRSSAHINKSPSYRFLHPWIGKALLASGGERWRIYRKVLTPAFHFGILHEFMPIFVKNSIIMTQRLAVEPEARSKKGFNILTHSSLCALDIMCESSLGVAVHAQENKDSPYVRAVIRVMELIAHRYFTAWLRPDFLYRFSMTRREMDKNVKLINDFGDRVIAERREYLKSLDTESSAETLEISGKRRNMVFLDTLLASETEYPQVLTQKDILGNVNAFIFAGYDTVTASMGFTLFLLGVHPDIQAKVVEELVAVFGDSGRVPDVSDLANLKYLERCIKEALRLYPSGPFFERAIEKDTELDGCLIPAGCTATFNVFSLHRDPEYFPNPEKFDPDRFLPENCQGRNPYAYMPFSAGPRNCIGQKFALLEERVILSTVLRRFRIEAAQSPSDIRLQVGMILRPENGLYIRIYEREDHPQLQVKIQ